MNFLAYLTAAILLGTAFWYGKQRQYKRTAILTAFWLVPLLIAKSIGKDLSVEQWICWSFAVAFLYFSHKLLKENHTGYAFVTFLVAAFVFFCGLTSVQTLLKTHLLWQVTSSLGSYGDKLDTFQTTVTEMKMGLEKQQGTNEFYQLELAKIQTTLRKGVTDVASQQTDITNQYRRLADLNDQLSKLQGSITNQFHQLVSLQSELATAQTNLFAQQKKVEDVEYWVQNFYSKMTNETFSAADKKSVLIFPLPMTTDALFVVAKLKHVPIPGSIRATVRSGEGFGSSLFSVEPVVRLRHDT